MQSCQIRDLPLKSKWKSHLVKAQYTTCAEVLLTSPLVLAKRTKLSSAEIAELVHDLSSGCIQANVAEVKAIADILQLHDSRLPKISNNSSERSNRVIKTGDSGFDALLGGGVQVGSLTEIAGQSASGKSHFCLQLAIQAYLPNKSGGVNGGTLFISSEGIAPSVRLVDLSRRSRSKCSEGTSRWNEWDIMDNVHFVKAQDIEAFESLLAYIVPARIERVAEFASKSSPLPPATQDGATFVERLTPRRAPLPIKLLVVDSIAAPFRASYNTHSMGLINRSKELGVIGDLLKRLAAIYDIAIVVVNQVSDLMEPFSKKISSLTPKASLETSSGGNYDPRLNAPAIAAHESFNLPAALYNRSQSPHFSGQTPFFHSIAALGHSWTNNINTRVMLSRTCRRTSAQSAIENFCSEGFLIRRMEVIFSPSVAKGYVHFVIVGEGLRSIPSGTTKTSDF